MEEFIERNGCI